MLKLTFYVPLDSKEKVKNALFTAGAGKLGQYERCSFETVGTGQFMGLSGANPSVGKIGVLEKIQEARVEMVLDDNILKEVINALRASHPYETPAFDIVTCLDL